MTFNDVDERPLRQSQPLLGLTSENNGHDVMIEALD